MPHTRNVIINLAFRLHAILSGCQCERGGCQGDQQSHPGGAAPPRAETSRCRKLLTRRNQAPALKSAFFCLPAACWYIESNNCHNPAAAMRLDQDRGTWRRCSMLSK